MLHRACKADNADQIVATVDSPGVVIEVPAAVREAAEQGPLLAACSSVIVEGDCVLSPGARDTIAIVSFDGEGGLSARIEVRIQSEGRTASSETLARFTASDPESERWQSLGLLIGAAAGQLRTSITVAPALTEVTPPRPAPEPQAHVRLKGGHAYPTPVPHTFRVRVGPSIGLDFFDATPALGVGFDAALSIHELVEIRAAASYSHGTREAQVAIDRVAFFGGIGLHVFRTEDGFFGSTFLDLGPELLRASNEYSAGERVIGVGRMGFDLGHDFDWLTVGLTTSLERDFSKTNVDVDGGRVGDSSVYSIHWAALIGGGF